MNKKGFTLVELLAVIVILAVVMLIAVTSVGPMMEKSRKSSLGSEGLSIIKAADTAYKAEGLKGTNANYTSTSSVCYSIKYLCDKGYFEKGCGSDGYTGSVLIDYKDGKYNYTFWLSNGTYTFTAANKDNYGEIDDVKIVYNGTNASNDCGKTLPLDTPSVAVEHNTAARVSIESKTVVECNNGCENSGAIVDSGKTVSNDGKYTSINSVVYNPGETIPESYEPQTGDKYEDIDYTYSYNQWFDTNYNVWVDATNQNGWGVRVNDVNKTAYGKLKSYINGKPVNTLHSTFHGCRYMKESPVIPNTVTDMNDTYAICAEMKVAPTIPNSVVVLSSTFAHCSGLTSGPTIPNSVREMKWTFNGCTNITSAPVIPEGVTNLYYAFHGCSSLSSAPVIPSAVTDLRGTFYNCPALKGDVVVNTNTTNYSSMFYNSAKDSNHTIVVKGSAPVENKNGMKATGYNAGAYITVN